MLDFKKVEVLNIPFLQLLANEIWNDSYQEMISQSQIDYMLDLMYSDEQLLKEINQNYHWYFMDFNNQTIGFLCFYPKDEKMFLSKIYVKKEFQGKGLAKFALDFIANETRKLQYKSLFLTVNKGNKNAIQSYKKFGFIIKESEIFDIGNGFIMDDYIMEFTL